MFTTAELDNYVNEAARGYLKEAKPLNETITKIAFEHGLNRDQIARVVEGANTEVYVQMMNHTNDKYIQFDNASMDKIAEAVFGVEKSAEIMTDDYEEEPSVEVVDDAFEKLASKEEKTPSETEKVNEAYKLAALDDRLINSMYEVDIRFQKNSDILYDFIKQAYLGGTSFGDIRRAIEWTYDSPVVKKIVDESQEKIANEIYPSKLNMEEKLDGSVNKNNTLIKQAGLLVKDAEEFITLKTKSDEVHKDMNKLSEELPIARAYFKKLGKAVVEKTAQQAKVAEPISKLKKGVALVGAGAIGGALFQGHMSNVRRQQAGMPMSFGSGQSRGRA